MNILFLSASPRENGCTSRVLRLIEKNIAQKHQVQWVRVNSLNMKPCQGCLKCRPDKECILPQDDAHIAARLIHEADALVIGSPTYFGNITGPLRTLVDRCLTAFEEIAANGLEAPIPIHAGQKAAIVTACNMPAPMSFMPTQGAGALSAMQVVINAGGYDLAGSIMVDGAAALKGIPDVIAEKAKDIAIALTS